MSNNIKQGSLDQITATSLLEDLKNPETKIKINAIHNLREISFALGRERTRKELLPFLISCIDEEEDEALVELAKILGNFIDCIGGINYIKELFNILEAILIVDDPNIRKETINSLKKTINQVEKIEFIENDIMEIIIRLGENENINQKISSLYIIIFIFPKLSEKNKEIVLNIILKFCKDETISLKKEVLNLIPEITQYLQINFIQKIISIFLEDKNDTTHIDIMNIIVSMKNLNNLSEIMDYLEKVLTKLACDNNWRVRLTVCDKLYEILSFPQITNKIKQTSIEIFVKLLEDSEAEVKNICCLRLEDMTKVLYKEDNFDRILKGIKKLEKDNTTYVRGALASNLLKICPFIGQKKNE
jgi:serine/threonine-protein phosphatase 2A regulatory subunit A